MVEAGASEITESEMLEAIFFGHEEIKRLVAFQQEIIDHIQPENKNLFQLNVMKHSLKSESFN